MPVYTIRNNITGERREYTMSISDYENFMAANPEMTREYSPIVVGVDNMNYGGKKPDGWFRDKLKSIKKHYGGEGMNTW